MTPPKVQTAQHHNHAENYADYDHIHPDRTRACRRWQCAVVAVRLGALALPHRLAMAPMTRDRSQPDGTPSRLNVEYYQQRASAAVIITEGTQPSADGQGYLLTPGIYTDEHVAGWAQVTDAVHEHGGPTGMPAIPEPRALSTEEVAAAVQDYRHAAACAIRAGADGVEIHSANGYLVHQFLSSNANQRTDRYGGSVMNRLRFAVEVAEAVADEIGADRTGFQISPGNTFNDITEDDVPELHGALIAALAPLQLAYLNIAHGDDGLRRWLSEGWPTWAPAHWPTPTSSSESRPAPS